MLVSIPKHLPFELVRHILSFCDSATLFSIGQHCNNLRPTTESLLLSSHCRYATIRLWICQPGMVAHKAVDFAFQGDVTDDKKLVFTSTPSPALQFKAGDDSHTLRIGGCTVRVQSGSGSRQMYSLSYPNAIELVDGSTACMEQENVALDAHPCNWQFKYDLSEKEGKRILTPQHLICDFDLLNPDVLSAYSKELLFPTANVKEDKISTKKSFKEKNTPNPIQNYTESIKVVTA